MIWFRSQLIVILVGANPEPIIVAVALASDGAIATTDFDSVNTAFLAEA